MGFDDAKTHRQSDARADPRGLGGEIGLEDPRAKMFRNAGTVVGDLDARPCPRGESKRLVTLIRRVRGTGPAATAAR